MNTFRTVVGLGILCLVFPSMGLSGFLDDLLKLRRQKKNPNGRAPRKGPGTTGLAGRSRRGIFGVKKKNIDLFKKGVGVVQALEPIGEEEEITLGEAVAIEAFSRFGGEYPNQAWTRYINLVGKTIG